MTSSDASVRPDYPQYGQLPSRLLLGVIVCGSGVYAAALGLAAALWRLFPPDFSAEEIVFPPAFWPSSVCLAAGSFFLQQAWESVRRERQRWFRGHLVAGLVSGTLFIGVQTYGLACLIRNQRPAEVETGVNAFVVMLTALHAIHFTLAMLCLLVVTLQAFAQRYDHEYHWGVAFCAWFWHSLGFVWLGVLFIFLVATQMK